MCPTELPVPSSLHYNWIQLQPVFYKKLVVYVYFTLRDLGRNLYSVFNTDFVINPSTRGMAPERCQTSPDCLRIAAQTTAMLSHLVYTVMLLTKT